MAEINSTATTHEELAKQFPQTARPFAVLYNDDPGCDSRKWAVNDESCMPTQEFEDMGMALKAAAALISECGWEEDARKQAQAFAEVIRVDSPSDTELDKILSDFEQSKPVIDDETLEKLDSMERSLEYSIRPRRLSLLMLTYSGKELAEMAQDKNKAEFVATAKIISESYINHLKNFVGLLETANTRTAIAMCFCENAEEVMKEAGMTLDADEESEAAHA